MTCAVGGIRNALGKSLAHLRHFFWFLSQIMAKGMRRVFEGLLINWDLFWRKP